MISSAAKNLSTNLGVLGHEEEILRLQVTMAHLVLVHVVDSTSTGTEFQASHLSTNLSATWHLAEGPADDLLHEDGRLDFREVARPRRGDINVECKCQVMPSVNSKFRSVAAITVLQCKKAVG